MDTPERTPLPDAVDHFLATTRQATEAEVWTEDAGEDAVTLFVRAAFDGARDLGATGTAQRRIERADVTDAGRLYDVLREMGEELFARLGPPTPAEARREPWEERRA